MCCPSEGNLHSQDTAILLEGFSEEVEIQYEMNTVSGCADGAGPDFNIKSITVPTNGLSTASGFLSIVYKYGVGYNAAILRNTQRAIERWNTIVGPNLYVALPGGGGSTRCYIVISYLCRGPGLYVLKRCFQMCRHISSLNQG
ncbi:hypothetical protein B0H17DRAFT_1129824 [Mycena rosella]|uniref:Uncharacterized protein n=1 Tax=Mycena rosella TaxID=1033263 RepID=A0AAD7DU13_MYCRO|nr:hypothetical protein B0H17DRAFT_1129824 [Mycena rosella]